MMRNGEAGGNEGRRPVPAQASKARVGLGDRRQSPRGSRDHRATASLAQRGTLICPSVGAGRAAERDWKAPSRVGWGPGDAPEATPASQQSLPSQSRARPGTLWRQDQLENQASPVCAA